MREHDTGIHNEPPRGDPQLIAAAEALRNWVYEQRATWPGPLASGVDPGHATKAKDVEAAQTSSWRASLSVLSGELDSAAGVATPASVVPPRVMEPDVPRPAAVHVLASAAVPQAIKVDAEAGFPDSMREPARGWALRGLIATALVALLGFGGWSARTYWLTQPRLPSKMGTAVLHSLPAGLEVRVDGAAVGKTPLTTELSVGRHVVEFWHRNSSRRLEIEIKAGKSTVERLDWAAKRKGSLEVLSDPEGATVIVDGTRRGVTPLTIDALSIGSHSVVLESAAGSLRRTVEIAADRVAQVTEAIYSGWLHVSSPIELQVSEKTRRLLLDDRNQILLPPGTHDLRFQNPALGYQETVSVDVKPGAITSISITPPPGLLTINASLPAEILVDGQRIGETPLLEYKIPLGTRLVIVKSITGAERWFTLTVTAKPIQLDVDFSKP